MYGTRNSLSLVEEVLEGQGLANWAENFENRILNVQFFNKLAFLGDFTCGNQLKLLLILTSEIRAKIASQPKGVNTEELQKIESDVDEIFTSTINETKSEYRPEAYQRIPVVTRRPYEYFTTDYQNTEFLANNNSITYEEAFPVQAEPMSTCLVSVRNQD